MKPQRPKITVVGSINMDLVIRCAVLPMPGQTVLADSAEEVCGGKGANQAVAAARAGGQVAMVGRTGDDAFAAKLLANLASEGIDCHHVRRTPDCISGMAIVAVEQTGQNEILVVPGANGRVTVDDIEQAKALIQASDVLLLQLEIPQEAVLAAARIARAAGVRVILDPAPAPAEYPEELLHVDLICPNETEATVLSGINASEINDAAAAATALQERGAAAVAITLGDRGSLLRTGAESEQIESCPITAVDTTAAGDAFAGALAVRWVETNDLREAVAFANAAGALAASRPGAQPGMALREEINQLRNS